MSHLVDVANRARDQHSIFSTVQQFCPDYGVLLELHTLTQVAHSYVYTLGRVLQLNVS